MSSTLLLSSCLFENDMSYPYLKGEIVSFEVEGQKAVSIDPKARAVKVELNETVDITDLKVIEVKLNDDAQFAEPFPSRLDLTSPKKVLVKTYQDYIWSISAVQNIERYVKCSLMAKDPLFNEAERTVAVFLLPDSNLKKVEFESMKLEKEGAKLVSTTGYELVEGRPVKRTVEIDEESFPLTLDCTLERTFTFELDGSRVDWKLSAVRKKGELKVDSVNPWCWSADVKAEYEGEGTPYLMFKPSGAEEWTRLDEVELDGVTITAKLTGLEQEKEYVVKVCTESAESSEFTFTTGAPLQLENMDFDQWYKNPKGTWYPGVDGEEKIWDTANKGAALMGKNPTTPESSFLAPGEDNTSAARMESMRVGMFAAGNIYCGSFREASLSGSIGAILEWGVPFAAKPKSLKGYYAYSPKKIDQVRKPYENLMGTMDKCQIVVMLTDWEQPFVVNTSEGIFVDQENDPHIIAYKKLESDVQTDGYVPFELELDYRRTDAMPKYAVIVACASYKGDYFTGGLGSVMYVDEFEFVYE